MVPSFLFILASSVCKSLQCLISTLTQGGKGGHLFRLTCSIVLWQGRGEEHCKQISLVCVGSARIVWATLGLPLLMVCVLSRSTLLRPQVALHGNCLMQALGCVHFPGLSCSGSCSWVLHKGTDSVGSAFCALPRSKQLRWPGAWWAHFPRCALCLITSLVPAASFPGCAVRAPSQVYCVSPLGSWSLTMTLLVDANHPGSQEDLVSNWEPAHSLVECAVSGAEIAPRLPVLAATCLPLCLWWGWGCEAVSTELASSPLVLPQLFVLWAGLTVP